VSASDLVRERAGLQHLRLLWRPLDDRRGAHRVVPVEVDCDDGAEDAPDDQQQKHARRDQPAVAPSLPCVEPPAPGRGIRIDRLEHVPRRQGVEN
jgi:hypothetical protein